jgi:hypothetical protein
MSCRSYGSATPSRPAFRIIAIPRRGKRASTASASTDQIPLEAHGILYATAAFFLANPLAQNPNARLKSHPLISTKMQRGDLEKLNLAALALGMTATFVWIGLMGFAVSQAIAWLL